MNMIANTTVVPRDGTGRFTGQGAFYSEKPASATRFTPLVHADRLQADQRERWKFGAKKCYTALSVLHRVAPMPKTAENRA